MHVGLNALTKEEHKDSTIHACMDAVQAECLPIYYSNRIVLLQAMKICTFYTPALIYVYSLKVHRFMTRNKRRTVDLLVLVPSRQRDKRSVSPLSLQTRVKFFLMIFINPQSILY